MKESSAIKISISMTPLFVLALSSMAHFIYTLILVTLSDSKTEVCWEAGIMAVICYGFISIRNFMENAHFENLNNKQK